MNIRKFLEENKSGGMRLINGEMISISGYLNNWYRGLNEGRYGEDEVRKMMIDLVNRRGGVKKGNNLGSRMMEMLEVEGYELDEFKGYVNVKLSLKELGLICVSIEEGLSGGLFWNGDIEVIENLNDRLVSILERMERNV